MGAFIKPELTAIQLPPLSVDRKTPPPVEAKRFVPIKARAPTFVFAGNPALATVQLVPLLVER